MTLFECFASTNEYCKERVVQHRLAEIGKYGVPKIDIPKCQWALTVFLLQLFPHGKEHNEEIKALVYKDAHVESGSSQKHFKRLVSIYDYEACDCLEPLCFARLKYLVNKQDKLRNGECIVRRTVEKRIKQVFTSVQAEKGISVACFAMLPIVGKEHTTYVEQLCGDALMEQYPDNPFYQRPVDSDQCEAYLRRFSHDPVHFQWVITALHKQQYTQQLIEKLVGKIRKPFKCYAVYQNGYKFRNKDFLELTQLTPGDLGESDYSNYLYAIFRTKKPVEPVERAHVIIRVLTEKQRSILGEIQQQMPKVLDSICKDLMICKGRISLEDIPQMYLHDETVKTELKRLIEMQ
jgi:hypothetical protein